MRIWIQGFEFYADLDPGTPKMRIRIQIRNPDSNVSFHFQMYFKSSGKKLRMNEKCLNQQYLLPYFLIYQMYYFDTVFRIQNL